MRPEAGVFLGIQVAAADRPRAYGRAAEDDRRQRARVPWTRPVLPDGSGGLRRRRHVEHVPDGHRCSRTSPRLCLEEGCTPFFAHHFVKGRQDPFAEPALADLAYAGSGQFARQWLLVAPRQPFDAEIGKFYLHFAYGGSWRSHCGSLASLDIEVGKLESDHDGRKWSVEIFSPSEERQARTEERKTEQERREAEKTQARKAKQERDDCDAIALAIGYLKTEPGHQATVKRLRDLTGWRQDRADHIVARMEKSGILKGTPGSRGIEGREDPQLSRFRAGRGLGGSCCDFQSMQSTWYGISTRYAQLGTPVPSSPYQVVCNLVRQECPPPKGGLLPGVPSCNWYMPHGIDPRNIHKPTLTVPS